MEKTLRLLCCTKVAVGSHQKTNGRWGTTNTTSTTTGETTTNTVVTKHANQQQELNRARDNDPAHLHLFTSTVCFVMTVISHSPCPWHQHDQLEHLLFAKKKKKKKNWITQQEKNHQRRHHLKYQIQTSYQSLGGKKKKKKKKRLRLNTFSDLIGNEIASRRGRTGSRNSSPRALVDCR